ATTGSQNAASYQLASEKAVMAIGGFNGSDPAPTLKQFKAYVKQGLIHYYIAGSSMGGTQMGGSDTASEISAWVAKHYTAKTVDGVTIYDLSSSAS
ncbi:MAG: glycosyl transferase family 39, partial [Bifidobacterium psychraerophilum]